MSIENALASVAVKDLATAEAWYTKFLGRAGSKPMAEVIEWIFPNGGGLRVYALAERAGQGSFTLAVRNIADEIAKLNAIGVDTSDQTSSPRLKTVMIVDRAGNHIALAEALDPSLAK
jgi:hypothetical protein